MLAVNGFILELDTRDIVAGPAAAIARSVYLVLWG